MPFSRARTVNSEPKTVQPSSPRAESVMEEYEQRRTAKEEDRQTGHKDSEAEARRIPADLLQEMMNLGSETPAGRSRRRWSVKRTSPWASMPMPVFGPVDTEDFLSAAIQGRQPVVEKYLSDDGNPNACDRLGRTALHRASMGGHLAVVCSLLDRGADVQSTDRLGSRPVHWACRGGRVEVIRALTERGGDLDARDKLHSTPLHVATRTGHGDIVEYLLSCGVRVNCRDREGDTALHDAVRLHRGAIVKLLIAAGADTQIRNHEGLTALEQVKQWHSDTMEIRQRVEQLREAGQQASDGREAGEH
ncbi:unnamed protein product [Gadus morhua 'NCC']